MAKAEEYIRSALLKVYKIGADEPIESTDGQDALDALNDMLFEWDGAGVSLGFTEVTALSDEVTIPDYAKRAVKFNLAVNIAGEYGVNISPAVIAIADRSYTALLSNAVVITEPVYPETLPVGSGNECGVFDRRFYPGPTEDVLVETGGSILTEDGE